MNNIPVVTVSQMRKVDRLMVEEIGVSILMMMENASRNTADLAKKMLEGSVKGKKIIILCGKGNNSGDGLGAARHLINFGGLVKIVLSSKPDQLREDPKTQYVVLENIGAQIYQPDINLDELAKLLKNSDLIIDALLGYNLKDDPKPPIDSYINLANSSDRPILAIDIPSGLSGEDGQPKNPTIKASATLTLALPKVGLIKDQAKEYVGSLYLSDLSVPDAVYKKLGIEVPVLFESNEVIRLLNQ